jgi:hypothetical protein
MKITQDVREYAKEQNVVEEKTLAVGMAERLRSLRRLEARFITGTCLMGRRNNIK